MGVNPVWLGVMIGVNLQTAFLTPPVGFALFYMRGVAPPSITTGDIYRGIIPFVVLQVAAIGHPVDCRRDSRPGCRKLVFPDPVARAPGEQRPGSVLDDILKAPTTARRRVRTRRSISSSNSAGRRTARRPAATRSSTGCRAIRQPAMTSGMPDNEGRRSPPAPRGR